MPSFLPPDTNDLRAWIVARNARRVRAVTAFFASWIERATAGKQHLAARREVLRLLQAVLSSVRGREWNDLLYRPGMRAWLAATEEGLALVDPTLSPPELFDRIAKGPHLPRLLPHGRLDADFPRRAARLGSEMLERSLKRLPPILAFSVPSGLRSGPFSLDLEEDAEEARMRGELHLSTPAPLTLVLPRGALVELTGPSHVRSPKQVRVREGRGIRIITRGDIRCIEPECIPRSGIVIRRRVRWTRKGTVPGPHVRDAARRLGEALALLDEAWPEAGREVRAQTFEVVPLVESGTVSYSLPSRPGVSFINLHGKSVLDLADDLLHETAHHRLHGLEEIEGSLDRDDAEPRYWSPWRRSIRPVHGILHAAYTFTWRAALLTRLLTVDRELPRNWVRKQRGMEVEMLEQAVGSLRDARGRGLLTKSGSKIVRSIASRLHGMA